MAHCCVAFCKNDWRYRDKYTERTGKLLHFHQFPADMKRRKEWIIAVRRDEGENFQVYDWTHAAAAGTEPFHSRANPLPGVNVPIEPWPVTCSFLWIVTSLLLMNWN